MVRYITHIGWIVVFLLSALPVFLGSVSVAQWAEEKVYPVVKNTEMYLTSSNENSITVDVYFEKVRDCQFIKLVTYEVLPQDIYRSVDYSFNSNTAVGSRPVGRQIGSNWTFNTLSLENLVVYAMHTCNPLWTTKTRMWG